MPGRKTLLVSSNALGEETKGGKGYPLSKQTVARAGGEREDRPAKRKEDLEEQPEGKLPKKRLKRASSLMGRPHPGQTWTLL
eukprot:5155176-Amphidinium_carterae.1